MKHQNRASIAEFDSGAGACADRRVSGDGDHTAPWGDTVSGCGALPVAVPYSSKCSRFMEMAGLEGLVEPGNLGVPGRSTDRALDDAWRNCGSW
ncbi:MAG: hypothetical protein MZV70_22680 [Desulfobacterales bacterium]|nr:hypothetical protein [Desulfobacterales bacterium]